MSYAPDDPPAPDSPRTEDSDVADGPGLEPAPAEAGVAAELADPGSAGSARAGLHLARPSAPPPYRLDPTDVTSAAMVLDTAFAEIMDSPGGWGEVERAADAHGGFDESLTRELAGIGGRTLVLGGLGQADCEVSFDQFWLPDPKTASEDVVRLWRELLDQVTTPAAKARLAELLLARRDGAPPDRARLAALSYIDAVGAVTGKDNLTSSTYLARAWTISRKFRLVDVEDRVLDELEARIQAPDMLEYPGVYMPMLAIMARKPSTASRQAALHAVAETVLASVGFSTPMSHIIGEAGDLRRQMVVPGPDAEAKRAQIRADEMKALRNVAAQVGLHPMVKLHHLTEAAAFATRHRLQTDLREIQRELEAVAASDLGFQSIKTTGYIPAWVPELGLHPYVRGHTWHHGILYFLMSGSPGGDVERARKAEENRDTSFRELLSPTLFGGGNLPRATLTTEEEKFNHRVGERVGFTALDAGGIHAEGLRRLAAKYGTPTEDELTSLLISEYRCDPAAANLLAKCFGHFWAGRFLEVTHLAAPATEAAARRLLRELDEGVYQVQVGKSAGKYPGLGVLLDELLTFGLDPSWHFFMTWLLLGPDGANVRNHVAHGFMVEPDSTYAALVLKAAAALITASGSIADDEKRIKLAALPAPRSGLRAWATGSWIVRRGCSSEATWPWRASDVPVAELVTANFCS